MGEKKKTKKGIASGVEYGVTLGPDGVFYVSVNRLGASLGKAWKPLPLELNEHLKAAINELLK